MGSSIRAQTAPGLALLLLLLPTRTAPQLLLLLLPMSCYIVCSQNQSSDSAWSSTATAKLTSSLVQHMGGLMRKALPYRPGGTDENQRVRCDWGRAGTLGPASS